MIILIISALLLGLGIVLICKSDSYGNLNLVGCLTTVFSGILFLIMLVGIPVSRSTEKANIREYYSTKQTIEIARTSGVSDVERAVLLNKIIDDNNWLTDVQYANKSILWWDLYTPDEVMKLKPLK